MYKRNIWKLFKRVESVFSHEAYLPVLFLPINHTNIHCYSKEKIINLTL